MAKKDAEVDVKEIDFSEISKDVEASGRRGRRRDIRLTDEQSHVITAWIEGSDAPELPFAALPDIFDELVTLDSDPEKMLAKARGDVKADEVEDVTKNQTKIAKTLKPVVDGRAEVRAMDYKGQATYGLYRRKTEGGES